MGAITTIAAGISALAAAAGTGHAVYSQREAKKDAKEARTEQETVQRKLEKEARDRQAKDDSARAREQARQAQRVAATREQGRRSTIRTSSFGVPNDDAVYFRQMALGL